MLKESRTEDKSCLFYVSDYHFEMIALPYMNQKMKEANNVIVMTENNLEESISHLLSKVNLEENDKNRISNINWKNKDIENIKEISRFYKNDNNTVIFVKGKEEYINNVNKEIEGVFSNGNIQVVNCYDIAQMNDSIVDITKNYGSILSTTGLKKL